MHIKPKLNQILSRIKYVFSNDIVSNFNSDYIKGFEHAVKLFRVAVLKEFDKYVQIEHNKSLEIRELKNEVERLSLALSNLKLKNNRSVKRKG